MSKSKKRNNAKLSRREMLKLSALAGGSALLAAQGLPATAAPVRPYQSLPPQSPATRPFMEELPIMPTAQPVEQLDPPPDPKAHQRYNEFRPRKFYEINQMANMHSYHPDLKPSLIWGYNGITPGPTFKVKYGEPVMVRFHNNLPTDHIGFGQPETSIHLHNGHTASESDGFPGDFFPAGTFKDNHYVNILAGQDEREALSTLWYHDHRVDFTSQNIYRGLAGFFLLFDSLDNGNESSLSPDGLNLPSGEFDVPLFFQDRVFDKNGQLLFDVFNISGVLGDKFIVNGKIQPFFKVARRKYRFRFLNGGPSRFYDFFLSNGQPFVQISSDGNLLPAPIERESIRMSVAERIDVIIDFSKAKIGDQIFLENRLEQLGGEGPTDLILDQKDATQILRFDVDRDATDNSRIPETLRPLRPLDFREVSATRTWIFNKKNGMWTINDKIFNLNRVDAAIKMGSTERWILRNDSLNWHHPIHIHFEEFRMIARNGETPPPHELGRKDMAELRPGDEIELLIRFRDFMGKYIMHCHNLVHEDHAMMVRFDIVP